ncbi:MAG: hypothetical protein GY844_32575 [Bradyrhizobium sp.]|nr:hypothetical protein [Bradyrhizobium sp.]
MRLLARPYVICAVGAAVCAFLTILPDIVAAIFAPADMVWSPVNSLQWRYNDSYYQVPWVRAITAGNLLPVTPANIDDTGLGFETVRIVPFWLSSLPGLIFSDIRFIIVASFVLTAAAIYSLSFTIARHFTNSIAIAAAAGVVSYFFQAVWAYLAVELWVGPVKGLAYLTPYGLRIPWLLDITDTAMINSNLRFVSIAGSVPVLLLNYLACLRVARDGTWPWLATLTVTLCALPFSYPTHAYVGYAIGGGYGLIALVTRDWRGAARFAVPAVIAGAFLLAVDYLGLLKASRESSPIYLEILRLTSSNLLDMVRTDMPAREIALTLIFNKYNLALPLLLLLARPVAERVRAVIVLYLASVPVILLHVGPSDMSHLPALFAQRGIDVIWPILISPLVAGGVLGLFRKGRVRDAIAILIAVVIFAIPVVSFAGYAGRIVTTNAIRPLLIPKSDWDAYGYLFKNTKPNEEIIAASWNDIELLPMFEPVNLFVANNALHQRSMTNLLGRYIAMQKFFGMSRSEFESLLDNTFRIWIGGADRINDRSRDMKHPIHADADFEVGHFSFSILYWPYVRQLEGVRFSTEDLLSPTPEFKSFALELFDRTNATATLCQSKAGPIIVSASDSRSVRAIEERGMRPRFRTPTKVIYSFDRARICQ